MMYGRPYPAPSASSGGGDGGSVDLTPLENRVGAAEGEIDALQAADTALASRVTAAEQDIDNLQEDAQGFATRLNAVEQRPVADLSPVENRVSAVESNITGLQNAWGTHDNRLNALDMAATALDGRLDALEATPPGTDTELTQRVTDIEAMGISIEVLPMARVEGAVPVNPEAPLAITHGSTFGIHLTSGPVSQILYVAGETAEAFVSRFQAAVQTMPNGNLIGVALDGDGRIQIDAPFGFDLTYSAPDTLNAFGLTAGPFEAVGRTDRYVATDDTTWSTGYGKSQGGVNADFDDRITALEGADPAALGERLDAAEQGIAALDGRASALESSAASLDGRTDALESSATNHGTRLTAAEESIADLEAGLASSALPPIPGGTAEGWVLTAILEGGTLKPRWAQPPAGGGGIADASSEQNIAS